jgi:putative nucleotidyltransferase with HDIG domain
VNRTAEAGLQYTGVPSARELLERAAACERRGGLGEASMLYEQVIARQDLGPAELSVALRKRGSIHRRRHELDRARTLLQQACDVAASTDDATLLAESLNSLAMLHFASCEWEQARQLLNEALAAGSTDQGLHARIEQNLGIMANVEGELDVALDHYHRSLSGFRAAGDTQGCAVAYHNIGMNSADRALWEEADASFRATLDLAAQTGDVQLRGLALLNRSEVLLARQQFEDARRGLGEALSIFDELGARDLKAEAYKFLGVMFREMGRPELAEARLRTSVEMASAIGATLAEAEATRELALLYGEMGRNQDTLKLLTAAHRLFGRLQARRDLVDVSTKVAHLEGIYLDVVTQWGASIESADTYTFGHSSRVAEYGERVARALGLPDVEVTTMRVGAHLHDLGKVRIPHEILNKPGRLTDAELQVMQQHPLHGLELLAAVDFPWDVKPIIRSHHEKLNGTGYPDRLRGDEIPLHAQVACVVDVYDALTTTRSYRPALTHDVALSTMQETRSWWRNDVYEAFMDSVGRGADAAL